MQQIKVQSNIVNNTLGSKALGEKISDQEFLSFADQLNLIQEDNIQLDNLINIAQIDLTSSDLAKNNIEHIDSLEEVDKKVDENDPNHINYSLIYDINTKNQPENIKETEGSSRAALFNKLDNQNKLQDEFQKENIKFSQGVKNDIKEAESFSINDSLIMANRITPENSLNINKLNLKEEQLSEIEITDLVNDKILRDSVTETSKGLLEDNNDKENQHQESSLDKQNSTDQSGIAYKDNSFSDFITKNSKLTVEDIKQGYLSSSELVSNNDDVVNFKISKIISKNEHHIEVSLSPEKLGKINIRIEDHAHGINKLIISAERQETLNLLSENIKELHRELTEIGIKTDNSTTEFNLDSKNQSQQDKNESANTLAFLSLIKDKEEKETLDPAYINNAYDTLKASGRVNFKV